MGEAPAELLLASESEEPEVVAEAPLEPPAAAAAVVPELLPSVDEVAAVAPDEVIAAEVAMLVALPFVAAAEPAADDEP